MHLGARLVSFNHDAQVPISAPEGPSSIIILQEERAYDCYLKEERWAKSERDYLPIEI